MKECEAEALATMSEADARVKILEHMELRLDFGYDEELRSVIHTNLLYDTFTYTLLKGFSWRDVCIAVQLSEEMLQHLIGKPLVEATNIYEKAALKSGMDNRNLAVYTDYFFATFMKHYKLYQYVFRCERGLTRFVTSVAVEAPPPPEELKHAKAPHLHEYDQQLREIQSHREEIKEIEPITEVTVGVEEDLMHCSQTEALQKIISQVIQDVGRPMVENVSDAISTTYSDLETKLEETALARPKQLGPPPRYTLKPALSMPKATTTLTKPPAQKNSAKGDRKKSGKAK